MNRDALGPVPKLGTRISKPSKPLNFPIPHRRTSVWLFVLENPMIPIISDLHIPNLGTGPKVVFVPAWHIASFTFVE